MPNGNIPASPTLAPYPILRSVLNDIVQVRREDDKSEESSNQNTGI